MTPDSREADYALIEKSLISGINVTGMIADLNQRTRGGIFGPGLVNVADVILIASYKITFALFYIGLQIRRLRR